MTGLVANLVPGPVGWALRAFGTAKSFIGGAIEWVTASAAHLLMVALAAALAWGWLGHHKAAKWEKVAHSTEVARKADSRTWAAADRINHRSIDDLIAVLAGQSKMIRAWGDVADAKQKAAQAALRSATARGVRAEALAQRIEAERAAGGSGGPDCRSGKAVLDAKGEL